MPFVEEHLTAFHELRDAARPQGPVGMAPMEWAISVGYHALPGTLNNAQLDRGQVREYCRLENGNTILDCFVTIMAWGGRALKLPDRQRAYNARGC